MQLETLLLGVARAPFPVPSDLFTKDSACQRLPSAQLRAQLGVLRARGGCRQTDSGCGTGAGGTLRSALPEHPKAGGAQGAASTV